MFTKKIFFLFFRPPATRIQDKVFIPQDDHPHVNFIGLLIGPRYFVQNVSLQNNSIKKIIAFFHVLDLQFCVCVLAFFRGNTLKKTEKDVSIYGKHFTASQMHALQSSNLEGKIVGQIFFMKSQGNWQKKISFVK